MITLNQIQSCLPYTVPDNVLKRVYRNSVSIALYQGYKDSELIKNVLALVRHKTKKYQGGNKKSVS